MASIPIDKFNLNRFWEKTPTALKYILVFSLFLIVFYFLFSRRMDDNNLAQIDQMKQGITATYELINNFDEFRREQDSYNKEVLDYLKNLYILIEDLNSNTNRKLDMILSSRGKSADQKFIIEKIILLNESFEKLSKAYQKNIRVPNLDDNKVKKNYNFNPQEIPIDKNEGLKEQKFSIKAKKIDTSKIRK